MRKGYLLLDESPLQVLPTLACAIGLEEAIILQQLNYLLRDESVSGKIIDGERWIFNTYEDWQKKYFKFWTIDKIKKAFISLEKRFLVESCQPEGLISRRKYYRVNKGAFENLTFQNYDGAVAHVPDGAVAHVRCAATHVPITEITNKDNTEITGSDDFSWENEPKEQNTIGNDKPQLELIPSKDKTETVTPKEFEDAWKRNVFLQRIAQMSPGRCKLLAARSRDPFWRENWREALKRVAASPFHRGENDRGWTANVEWFLRPDTVLRMIEKADYKPSLEPAAATGIDRSRYTEEQFQRYVADQLPGEVGKLSLKTYPENLFKEFIKYADDYK